MIDPAFLSVIIQTGILISVAYASGSLVYYKGVKVNYTRKINHFALFFVPMFLDNILPVESSIESIIIGSFLAQGYKSIDAAKLGVFLHGKSGDILLNKKHNRGILARDIIRVLPGAIHSLVEDSVLEVKNYIKNEN